MVNSFQGVGGQAESSGCVKIGDVIVAVNGRKLDRTTDAHSLVQLIKKLTRPVMITFIHAGITPEALECIEAKETRSVARVMDCVGDGYIPSMLPGETLRDVIQVRREKKEKKNPPPPPPQNQIKRN